MCAARRFAGWSVDRCGPVVASYGGSARVLSGGSVAGKPPQVAGGELTRSKSAASRVRPAPAARVARNAQPRMAVADVLTPLGHRVRVPADPVRCFLPRPGRRRPGVPPVQVVLEPGGQDEPVRGDSGGRRRVPVIRCSPVGPAATLSPRAGPGSWSGTSSRPGSRRVAAQQALHPDLGMPLLHRRRMPGGRATRKPRSPETYSTEEELSLRSHHVPCSKTRVPADRDTPRSAAGNVMVHPALRPNVRFCPGRARHVPDSCITINGTGPHRSPAGGVGSQR